MLRYIACYKGWQWQNNKYLSIYMYYNLAHYQDQISSETYNPILYMNYSWNWTRPITKSIENIFQTFNVLRWLLSNLFKIVNFFVFFSTDSDDFLLEVRIFFESCQQICFSFAIFLRGRSWDGGRFRFRLKWTADKIKDNSSLPFVYQNVHVSPPNKRIQIEIRRFTLTQLNTCDKGYMYIYLLLILLTPCL